VSEPDSKHPTNPPPFDPEEYARSSDEALLAAHDPRRTPQIMPPPPLNKRVRLAVPVSDLEWFELTAEAAALIARMDGTTTLLELMEGVSSDDVLRIVAELHDAKLLAYE
jgi:hypothetical protein